MMRMPYSFARRLMNDLTQMALYANGSEVKTVFEVEEAEAYSRALFARLCADWEEEMHEKWEIV